MKLFFFEEKKVESNTDSFKLNEFFTQSFLLLENFTLNYIGTNLL